MLTLHITNGLAKGQRLHSQEVEVTLSIILRTSLFPFRSKGLSFSETVSFVSYFPFDGVSDLSVLS